MKKWSEFNFKFKVDSKIVLFNTINKGIVTIEINKYDEITTSLESYPDISSNTEELIQLIEMGFIVDSCVDEFTNFFNFVLLSREKENTLSVVLLTTSNCNFSCYYCIEDGIQKSHNLSSKTASSFLSYLRQIIEVNNLKELSITLYGGEPTLVWDITIETLSKVNQICIEKNITLTTSIITNGYLFDKKKVLDLLPFNLKTVQITLDGSRDYHNKRRFTKDKKPTFDVIIANIHDILQVTDNVRVFIRMNCDSDNIVSIPELADYLYQCFGYERITIDFGNIVNNSLDTTNIQSTSQSNTYYAINEELFIEQLPQLYSILRSHGLPMIEYYSFNGYCMAKTKYSFCLFPNGDIYKCMCEVGKADYKAGSIFNPKQLKCYFNRDLYYNCIKKKCCFLPFCHTGCTYKSRFKVLKSPEICSNRKQIELLNKKIITTNLNSLSSSE